MKPIESTAGYVTMADGTQREAYRNTYPVTEFHADGTFTTTSETRIEFLLFTNRANGSGDKFRKTSAKQAATFVA